ncbi:MAG: TonB-dependent receptor [Pseudomonadales bacterium]|nr:TonB-dependent receptor [Pseudomonadales bacterium]
MSRPFAKKTLVLSTSLLISSSAIFAASIEEIVVTAQKKEESLQDIPMAISAFSGEQIAEDGIKDLNDIQGRTPGLVVANFSPGQPEIAIRGIGTKEDGAAAGDSTVVSVDDVYIAARTAQVFDIFDLERIEVLRGPQGTLYGKNSIGGSINFITKKPTQQREFNFRQTIAEWDTFDTAAYISGGLSENVAGKVSLSRRKTDGFIENIPLNKDDTGESETLSYRAQLVWDASESTEITLTLDGADDDIGDTNRQPFKVKSREVTPALGSGVSDGNLNDYNNPIAVNRTLGALYGKNANDPHKSFSDDIGFTDREVFGASLKLNWEINDLYSFTSITAYRENEFDWAEDSEGLPAANNNDGAFSTSGDPSLIAPIQGFRRDATDTAIEDNEQFTQEFRVSYSSDSVDWIVGLFYSKENIERVETFYFGNYLNFGDWRTTAGGPPNAVPNYLGNIAISPVNVSDQENDSTSWAVYGQTTFRLNEKMRLTLGLRYSEEEKEYTASGQAFLDAFVDAQGTLAATGIPNIDVLNSTAISVTVQNFDPITTEDDWENVSGRIAFDWDLTDDTLFYASAATGFKSGGFTGTPSSPSVASTPFDPEEALNLEVGIKSLFFNRRLQLNASAFWTDYDELQVTFYTVPLGSAVAFGEFFTENASSATIKGFELELQAYPTDELQVGGSIAYLDSEYEDFLTSTVVDGGGGRCDGGNAVLQIAGDPTQGCQLDFSGKNLRQAPELTAYLYTKYLWTLDSGANISAKIDLRYQDESFYDPDNNDTTLIPSYSLINARLAYGSANGRWEIALWGKNINDKDYVTHIYSQRGGSISFANYGPPRQYGLTFTYSL